MIDVAELNSHYGKGLLPSTKTAGFQEDAEAAPTREFERGCVFFAETTMGSGSRTTGLGKITDVNSGDGIER
jgi:hypothetical protein